MKQHETSNTGVCSLDPTEGSRQERLEQINAEPGSRPALEAVYGQVWDTSELQRDYIVVGFLAPFVVVRRRDNREEGSLEFQHQPRFYFNYRSNER